MIIDGTTCYFACNTHLSGLKKGSAEFSEKATLVKSTRKVPYLGSYICTACFHVFHFSEFEPPSKLCAIQIADYNYGDGEFGYEMEAG